MIDQVNVQIIGLLVNAAKTASEIYIASLNAPTADIRDKSETLVAQLLTQATEMAKSGE
jgi:hypothetical protein